MTSSPSAPTKPAHHRQRRKLIIRKSCRKIKDCSIKIAAGQVPAIELLHESEAALKALYEACSGVDQQENETDVEAMLGSLPLFLGQFKGDLEVTMNKTMQWSPTGHKREKSEQALKVLFTLSNEWHQRLQQRIDEALQTRRAWEEKHPVQMSQEHELSLYTQSLLPLLEAPSARTVSAMKWKEAETSLDSLQIYLLDNKILAEQVRSGGKNGIEPVLGNLLRKMEEWDAEGLGFKEDDRVDLKVIEKIWGRVDKIGSGLNYLLVLNARGDTVDGVQPTTRSVFLLKSAPPARLSFSSSKDVWLVKKLSESKERLTEIVLNSSNADIKRADERRWNAAYKELEALDEFVKREAEQISPKTINESGIDEIIRLLCAKLESLHTPLKADEDDSAFALMYISWELTMRIGVTLGVVTDTRQNETAAPPDAALEVDSTPG